MKEPGNETMGTVAELGVIDGCHWTVLLLTCTLLLEDDRRLCDHEMCCMNS